MAKIALSIDGRELNANPGDSVLDVALSHDIYIPHLCHDPVLKPHGGCRLCLVSIQGAKGFRASCITQVADGMAVTTSGVELELLRRDMLELILAEHPLDCLSCVKNQRCDLQKVAAYIGGATRSLRRTRTSASGKKITPCFSMERDYCILCQKCVRTCDELVQKRLLTVVNRGAESAVSTFANQAQITDTCASCLECVKRCPTAALRPL